MPTSGAGCHFWYNARPAPPSGGPEHGPAGARVAAPPPPAP
jgi:hypothetical protein